MPDTMDGNQKLAEQQSAIRFKEAKGYKLQTLEAGAKEPPTNVAVFERLPAGELPDLFRLVLQAVPDGKKAVWTGKIFVRGKLKTAAAYRVPE